MGSPKFDEQMARLLKASGTKNNAGLAAALGITAQSVSGWRKRGRIPTRWLQLLADKYKVSVDWLLFGDSPVEMPGEKPVIADMDSNGQEPELLALRKENSELNKELRRLLLDYNDVRGKLFEKQIDPERDLVVPVVGLAECSMRGWCVRKRSPLHSNAPLDIVQSKGFAVVAVGDSMVPAGIEPDFVLFCNPQIEAEPGHIVYFENKEGRATIKIYRGESKLQDGQKAVALQGWLPAPEDGHDGQKPYTDQIAVSKVKRIVPVAYIKRL